MSPLDARMAELSARFARNAAEERSALSAARDRGDRAGLRDRAHKLAGIAGMFGFPEVGEAALALEDALDEGRDVTEAAERLESMLAGIAPAA